MCRSQAPTASALLPFAVKHVLHDQHGTDTVAKMVSTKSSVAANNIPAPTKPPPPSELHRQDSDATHSTVASHESYATATHSTTTNLKVRPMPQINLLTTSTSPQRGTTEDPHASAMMKASYHDCNTCGNDSNNATAVLFTPKPNENCQSPPLTSPPPTPRHSTSIRHSFVFLDDLPESLYLPIL